MRALPETIEHEPDDCARLAGARAILAPLIADVREGRRFWDGGPEWERLRLHTVRVFIVLPAARFARSGLRAAMALLRRRARPAIADRSAASTSAP